MTTQAAEAIAEVKAAADANKAVLLGEHESPARGTFPHKYCLTYRTVSKQDLVYMIQDDGQITRAAI